jgi:toxin-antitoxin system PIN domain toxin
VKLLDANILLYAVNADFPAHRSAHSWIEETLSGTETVGFSWVVLLAFLRISTRPGIFNRPLSPAESLDLVESWLAQPCATVVHPGDSHSRILRDLFAVLGTAGNITSDAHLAALAIEHGAELCSCDSDFSRFPGLRWQNPLSRA